MTRVYTCFSIFPALRVCPFVFFFFFLPSKKSLGTQLFQDLLADFLEIKFMNTYGYVDVH